MSAAPALADDASVERAWDAHDRQFKKLGKDYRRALNRWGRSDLRRSEPVLRVIGRTRRLLERNTRGVRREQTSTAIGARAKRFALRSNRAFGRQLRFEARSVRLTTAGKRRAGARAYRRADRAYRVSTRAAKRARKLFRRARADG